ncbi:hypothetical protein PV327_000482 [Microctonus hyperodae]|uniref:RRM domain-containing protein n=1 Tax=Microctonus hyperodae TaxID=165561 RepID=A0AA39L213_MICHY|nr:hypothetical protein PV327_000482 [Microctonus hyperodae]
MRILFIRNTDSNLFNDSQGFISVGKDKGKKFHYENLSSGECGRKAYELILENEKLLACNFLSKAIELDSTDVRHYINRSYCFLSLGEYSRVINDIQRIIIHTDNSKELCQLKCRQAQALSAMQNYDGAAECFNESLNFMPNCIAVKCENMRMKVDELKTMGFSEKSVLELLHDNPKIKIKDAVTFLCEFDFDDNNNNVINEDDEVDDEIFQSDSEDFPSNTKIFMSIIDFDADNVDESWYEVSDCTKNSLTNNAARDTVKVQMTNDLRVINAAATSKSSTKKSAFNNCHGKAIWVGNLNSKITESVLTEHFSKFGKVSCVTKRSVRYGFINYQCAGAAKKALESGSIFIDGTELLIKPAS